MAGISLAELVQLKGNCLFCSWQVCAQHPAQGTQLLPPPSPPSTLSLPWGHVGCKTSVTSVPMQGSGTWP